MKKPRRRGDSGLLRVPLRGNLMMMGREKPHHCKIDSTSPVQGNPSEYELFVINNRLAQHTERRRLPSICHCDAVA